MLACTSPTDMKMQLELPFKSDFFWHTEEWLKYDISVNWSLYNWKFKVKVFFHITDAVISTFVFNSRKKATQLQEENKWVSRMFCELDVSDFPCITAAQSPCQVMTTLRIQQGPFHIHKLHFSVFCGSQRGQSAQEMFPIGSRVSHKDFMSEVLVHPNFWECVQRIFWMLLSKNNWDVEIVFPYLLMEETPLNVESFVVYHSKFRQSKCLDIRHHFDRGLSQTHDSLLDPSLTPCKAGGGNPIITRIL